MTLTIVELKHVLTRLSVFVCIEFPFVPKYSVLNIKPFTYITATDILVDIIIRVWNLP